jgi:hypothetical protein
MRENKEVGRLLSSQTKLVEEAGGSLSRLFRQILFDINLESFRWSTLMDNYVKDKRNRIEQNNKDISSAKGNLAKELVRPDMTWKVFNKAMRFLNPKRVRIIIAIDWQNKKTTLHEVTIYKSLQNAGIDYGQFTDAMGERQEMINKKQLDQNLLDYLKYLDAKEKDFKD